MGTKYWMGMALAACAGLALDLGKASRDALASPRGVDAMAARPVPGC